MNSQKHFVINPINRDTPQQLLQFIPNENVDRTNISTPIRRRESLRLLEPPQLEKFDLPNRILAYAGDSIVYIMLHQRVK
jgi:hypothetical protein